MSSHAHAHSIVHFLRTELKRPREGHQIVVLLHLPLGWPSIENAATRLAYQRHGRVGSPGSTVTTDATAV